MRVRTIARRRRFTEQGRCVQCGAPGDAGGGLYCTTHIFKLAAYRWLDDVTRWGALKTLFTAQHGRCAYTGEALALGVNASIDHKIPRSRGGANEITNLQWVTWKANRCKADLTHAEFVAMCHAVTGRISLDAVFERVPHVDLPVRGEVS